MVKKYKDFVSESLANGSPFDFFKKIHEFSKERPIDAGENVLSDLLKNDAEDVEHMFTPQEAPKKNKK